MLELEELPATSEPVQQPLVQPAAGEKFISFEIGEKLFCVAAFCVQEVVHPIASSAVPLGPTWLLGLGAYKGEPVALIDPAVIAGPGRPLPNSKPKTIVFRSLANRTQFALPIDSLREMIVVAPDAINAGELVQNGRSIKLVDHDRLFESFDGTPT